MQNVQFHWTRLLVWSYACLKAPEFHSSIKKEEENLVTMSEEWIEFERKPNP